MNRPTTRNNFVIHADAESEELERPSNFFFALWAAIQEHFNPITAISDSWRMYRELQIRQLEIRLLQQAGERVPNRLWRGSGQQGAGQRAAAWSSMLSVLVACGLLIPLWLHFFTASFTAPYPYNLFAPDLLIAFLALALFIAAWVLMLVIFNPRWTQLWHISIARRRVVRQEQKDHRAFFLSRSAPRRLALLLGIAVYLSLLMAAAGTGNMPSALIAVSVSVGHARVLPIVFFPIAAEVLAGLIRRRRRQRQRLVNAGIESQSLQTTA